jgi:zinc transporter ZupT
MTTSKGVPHEPSQRAGLRTWFVFLVMVLSGMGMTAGLIGAVLPFFWAATAQTDQPQFVANAQLLSLALGVVSGVMLFMALRYFRRAGPVRRRSEL